MTIGIACICDSGSAVVIASDRMITIPHRAKDKDAEDTYFEDKYNRKIARLTPKCVILTAGTLFAHMELLNEVTPDIQASVKPSISKITEIIRSYFTALRTKPVEKRLFKRYGLTLEEFRANKARLDPDVVSHLNRQLKTANFDLNVIIAGADPTGAHIFHVFNPGKAECLDDIGYGAVGSGKEGAIASLKSKYSTRLNLPDTIRVVFEAKREAQLAPGVGKATDIGVIAAKRSLRYLVAEEILSLESTH